VEGDRRRAENNWLGSSFTHIPGYLCDVSDLTHSIGTPANISTERPSASACFVMMRRLKMEAAVAADEHFRQEGFATLP
jgi:hypothetical protein